MSENNKGWYAHQRFVFMTLDPVHIGTGGYRLGRVDNTIVREIGTDLPKIPGTSLMGAVRRYAAMRYGKPEAAGLHKAFKGDKNKCPILYTFGTATETGGGQAGKVSIGDARILFVPVHSIAGPVWISTKVILEEAGFTVSATDADDDTAISNLTWGKDNINLGWLMLAHHSGLNITPPESNEIESKKEWEAIKNRIIIISQKLFSQVVNSNLEVRTSVAIDPDTGAAEDKALFTYEALPRAAWLWCDVIEDDYKQSFPKTKKQFKDGKENSGEPLGRKENSGEPLGEEEEEWKKPMDVVKAGLKLIEYLGVGGMGTKGFGRMKQICDWRINED